MCYTDQAGSESFITALQEPFSLARVLPAKALLDASAYHVACYMQAIRFWVRSLR